MLVIIPFGPPGVGKGTQAELLGKKFKLPHISTGDLFRKNIKEETPLGVEAKEYIEKGALGPDSLVLDMIQMRIKEDDCKKGFILDGYPRTLDQARVLDEIIDPKTLAILHFDAPDETVVERISGRLLCSKCGTSYHRLFKPPQKPDICDACGGALFQRKDDAPDVIQKRLNEYHKKTAPIIDFYADRPHFFKIDCTESIDKIQSQLIALITPL
ncbi:MAG: adenylate kinase, partial [Simkaniaceae bacterium]|nr:adenylate kinase [Simkaniaceae bacterium]